MREFVIKDGILLKYEGRSEVVEIPKTVKEIALRAFWRSNTVKQLIIPEGVTHIKDAAFCGCSRLQSVQMPSSLRYIGRQAFSDCSKLSKINLSFVTTLGEAAMENTAITEANIPNVVRLHEYAFKSCKKLKNVTLSERLKEIKRGTFVWCTSLQAVRIPQNVEIVNLAAFYNCTSMESIYVPSSVKSIEYAGSLDGIKRLIIEGNFTKYIVPNAGDYVFDLRSNGVNVLDSSERKIKSLIQYVKNVSEGVLYSQDVHDDNVSYARRVRKKLLKIAMNNVLLMEYLCDNKILSIEDVTSAEPEFEGDVDIEARSKFLEYANSFSDEEKMAAFEREFNVDPNSVKGMSQIWGFKTNPDGTITINSVKQDFTTIVVPEMIGKRQVTALNNRAFKDKKSLKEVVIPPSVTKLGSKVFYGCNLDKLSMQGVNEISEETFEGCSIKRLEIGQSVQTIRFDIIKSIKGIQEITLGENEGFIKRVGDFIVSGDGITLFGYFDNAKNSNVMLPKSVKIICDKAFEGITSIESINFNNEVMHVGASAFSGCVNLKLVYGTSALESIGRHAFSFCPVLHSLDDTRNVKQMGQSAFSGCTTLYGMDLSALNEIPSFAFNGARAFNKVKFSDNLTRIMANAFKGTSLESLELPQSVNYIMNEAFANCAKLKTAILPHRLKNFGDGLFKGCIRLRYVYLGNALMRIPPKAFSNCKCLSQIELPPSVKRIHIEAFANCWSLERIGLNKMESIEASAFACCKKLQEITIPSTVKYLSIKTFYYCASLKKVNIEEGVIDIGSRCFNGCISLTQVTLPSSLINICDNAFVKADRLVMKVKPNSYAYNYARAKRIKIVN